MKKSTHKENEIVTATNAGVISYADVQQRIVCIRDKSVIIDADVVALYGVETRRVNEAVRNNPDKFPFDYMFVLTDEETRALRSKISSLEQVNERKGGEEWGNGILCAEVSKRYNESRDRKYLNA